MRPSNLISSKEPSNKYTVGFIKSAGNYYPGINALTLSCLLEHLTDAKMKKAERQALVGGVRWAVQCALNKNPDDYWAKATLGDLALLDDKAKHIEDLYREAMASPEKNRFALVSTLHQIQLMKDLGFRPAEVSGAKALFERAIAELPVPEQLIPRQVFLFSGHMIDAPQCPIPRFPADKEPMQPNPFAPN